jgi:hypothetical protein
MNKNNIVKFLNKNTDGQRGALIRMFLHNFSDSNQLSWIDTHSALLTELETNPSSLYALRSAIGHIAWKARSLGFPIPKFDKADRSVDRSAIYYICERNRYDFRFKSIADILEKNKAIFPPKDDDLLFAFELFAKSGLQDPDFGQEWQQAFRKIQQAKQYADERVASTLLHAMWFANNIPEQPENMLNLISFAEKRMNYQHHVFLYRKAFALRKKKMFNESLNAIDLALSKLDASEPCFLSVHQDYTREWELSILGVDLNNFKMEIEKELRCQMAKEIETAQKIVSDSMLKLIEILGLFIAIASAFLGSGALLLNNNLSIIHKIITLGILMSSLLAFFLILRLVLRFKR